LHGNFFSYSIWATNRADHGAFEEHFDEKKRSIRVGPEVVALKRGSGVLHEFSRSASRSRLGVCCTASGAGNQHQKENRIPKAKKVCILNPVNIAVGSDAPAGECLCLKAPMSRQHPICSSVHFRGIMIPSFIQDFLVSFHKQLSASSFTGPCLKVSGTPTWRLRERTIPRLPFSRKPTYFIHLAYRICYRTACDRAATFSSLNKPLPLYIGTFRPTKYSLALSVRSACDQLALHTNTRRQTYSFFRFHTATWTFVE
jgi:hypothetical protein